MAVGGTVGSVTVKLHPLVVMNISDHWTRVRAQEGVPKSGTYNTQGIPVSACFMCLRYIPLSHYAAIFKNIVTTFSFYLKPEIEHRQALFTALNCSLCSDINFRSLILSTIGPISPLALLP